MPLITERSRVRRRQGPAHQQALHERQPVSRAAFKSLLWACPLFLDALLARDALRPLSLVAEDLASLAIAVCASHDEMGGAWRQLAAACDARLAGPLEPSVTAAMLAVERAALADPCRRQWASSTAAQDLFRLGSQEVQKIPIDIVWYARSGQHSGFGLHRVLDLLRAAQRRHGSAAALRSVLRRADGGTLSHKHRLQLELLQRRVDPFEPLHFGDAREFCREEPRRGSRARAVDIAESVARQERGRVLLPPQVYGARAREGRLQRLRDEVV